MCQSHKVADSTESGRAVALVLPGMSLNATVFPPLPVATLRADFNQAAGDASSGGRGAAGDGMAAYVSAVDRLVDAPTWTDAERRLVIGHSFGGMLALAWWLHHGGRGPADIDGLILVATTAGPMYGAVRLRVLKARRHELRLGIGPLMRVWNNRTVTRSVHRILSRGVSESVDFQTLVHKTDLRVGLAGWRSTDWRARRSYRLAMWGFDVRAQLGRITVPTIVLSGGEDHLFPVAAGRELADGIRGAEFRLVDGAGHILPLTHGEDVVRAVRDLL
ncbi:MAG: alpha/beta hydrolase [Gemmatimonadales bacterium]